MRHIYSVPKDIVYLLLSALIMLTFLSSVCFLLEMDAKALRKSASLQESNHTEIVVSFRIHTHKEEKTSF